MTKLWRGLVWASVKKLVVIWLTWTFVWPNYLIAHNVMV